MLLAAVPLAEPHASASSSNGKHTPSPSLFAVGVRYGFLFMLLLVVAALILHRTSQGQRVAVWMRGVSTDKILGRTFLWLLTVVSDYTPETVNVSWILFFHMEFGNKMVRGLQSGNAQDTRMVLHRLRQLARYHLVEDVGKELHRYERADKRQSNPRPPGDHRTFGCWFLRGLVNQVGSSLDEGCRSFVEGLREGGWANDPAVLQNGANPLDIQGRTLLRLLTLCPLVARRAVSQHQDILSAAATMLETSGPSTSKEDGPDELFVHRCDEIFGVLGNLAMSGSSVVKQILDLKIVSFFASLVEEPWFEKRLSGSPAAKGSDAVLNAAARLLCALSRSAAYHVDLVEQRAVVALHTLVEMASTVTCAPALRHATLTVYYLSEIEGTVSEIRKRGQERLVLRMRTKLQKVCPHALGPDWANRQRKRVVSFFQTSAMPPKAAARAAAAAAAQANATSPSSPAHPDTSGGSRAPPQKAGTRGAGQSAGAQQPGGGGKRASSSRSAKGGTGLSGLSGGKGVSGRGGRRGKQSPKTGGAGGIRSSSAEVDASVQADVEKGAAGGAEESEVVGQPGGLRDARNGEMGAEVSERGQESGPREDGGLRPNAQGDACESPGAMSSGDEGTGSESGSETESSRSGSETENARSSGSSAESGQQSSTDQYRATSGGPQKKRLAVEEDEESQKQSVLSGNRGGKFKSTAGMNGKAQVSEAARPAKAANKDRDSTAAKVTPENTSVQANGKATHGTAKVNVVSKEAAPCKESVTKKFAGKTGKGAETLAPVVVRNAADVLRPDTPPLAPRAPKKSTPSEKPSPVSTPLHAPGPGPARAEPEPKQTEPPQPAHAPHPKLPHVILSTRHNPNARVLVSGRTPAAVASAAGSHPSLVRPAPAPSLFSRGPDTQLIRPGPPHTLDSDPASRGLATKIPFPSPVVTRVLTPPLTQTRSSPSHAAMSLDSSLSKASQAGNASPGEDLEERLMRTLLESPKPWVASPSPSVPDIASSIGSAALGGDVAPSRFPVLPSSATSLWLPDISSPPLRSETGTPPSPLWAFHPAPTPSHTRLMPTTQLPRPHDLTQLVTSSEDDDLDNSFLPPEFPFTPDPPGSEPLNLDVVETPSAHNPPPASSFLPWTSGGSSSSFGLGSSSMMETSSSLFGLSAGGGLAPSNVSTGLGGGAFSSYYYPFTAPVFSSEEPLSSEDLLVTSSGGVFSPVVGSGRPEYSTGPSRNVPASVVTPLPDDGELESGFICSPTQPSSPYATIAKGDSQPACALPGCGRQRGDGVRLSKCSRCFVALYCSKECQRQHWSAHKQSCKKNP